MSERLKLSGVHSYTRLTKTAALHSEVAVMPCLTGTAVFLVASMHLWWNTFPLSSRCLSCRLNAYYCFAWEDRPFSFHVSFSSNYPFSVSQPVGACQNGRNIRTSLFCLHSTPLQGRRRRGGTLSADSVENNEGGRVLQWGAAVLNMDNHMQHIHLHLHRASLQSTQHPLHVQQTPQHWDD